MEQKKSEFDKVLGAWDILVIAFGAMIGWGWVVSSGNWIQKGGVVGAAVAFAIGGVMIFFIGLTYAELTAAMPQCGGEHVFSYKAMGPNGSFICTWAIILGYVSVTCFEACAFPTIITYLWPGFLKGYMYTVAGFDIYASWVAVAVLVAFLITLINILGAKTAAVLQTVLTCIIGGAGILLIVASVINGDSGNLQGQMFVGESTGSMIQNIIKVAVVTPFFFIGFDVIPQAAEEINVPLKKIGKMMILSVVLAVVFYSCVILAVGYVLNPSAMTRGEAYTLIVTAIPEGGALSDGASTALVIRVRENQEIKTLDAPVLSIVGLEPAADGIVYSDSASLTFQWTAVEGASAYNLVIRDSTGALVKEATLMQQSVTFEGTELTRGAVYTVSVTALPEDELHAKGKPATLPFIIRIQKIESADTPVA